MRSISLVALLLPLISSAAAEGSVPSGDSSEALLTIPLTKRGGSAPHWKRRNGSIFVPALEQEAAKADLKYHKNGKILDKRSGKPTHQVIKRAKGLVALEIESYCVWSGQITVGTPPQSFKMYFDSGSTDLTLPIAGCTPDNCGSKAQYNPRRSSTAVNQNKTLQSTFADGSASKGAWYKDVVTAGGVTANQTIIAASQLSSTIKSLQSDGILGLAFPSLSASSQPSFPFSLNANGQGSVFGIRLSETENESEITFGNRLNSQRIAGKMTYYSVANSPGQTGRSYWQIGDCAPTVNGTQAIRRRANHIIDSGTTFIIAPLASAAEFYSKINGSKPYIAGHWTFPCATPPAIAFSFRRGATFGIKPDDFNLGYLPEDPTRCAGAIIGQDLGLGTSWVLGATFLKSWYTLFDVAGSRIGFAPPS